MAAWALALAAAMDLRADAMLSFFPILVVVWRRLGLAILAWCVMAAVALAFVPFLLPHISLRGFIAAQMVTAHHGFDARLFRSMTFGIMLGTLLVSAARVADRSVVAATAASMVLITVVASSPGTGPTPFHAAASGPALAFIGGLRDRNVKVESMAAVVWPSRVLMKGLNQELGLVG